MDNTVCVLEFQITRCGDVHLSSSQKQVMEMGLSHRKSRGSQLFPSQGGHTQLVCQRLTPVGPNQEGFPTRPVLGSQGPAGGTPRGETGSSLARQKLRNSGRVGGRQGCRGNCRFHISTFLGVMATRAQTSDLLRALCHLPFLWGQGRDLLPT